LQPKGTQGFLQPFDVVVGAELTGDNRFAVASAGGETMLALHDDYLPFPFSTSGEAAGPLVFAGYGISADDWKYDDYHGLDISGKIVVVFRGEPPLDPARKKAGGDHGGVIAKAILARRLGAKAVIVVNGRLERGEEDLMPHFGGEGSPVDVGIPVIAVKNDVVAEWLALGGKDLGAVQRQIDASGVPASFALPDKVRVSLTTGVEKKHATVSNVLAYLPGTTDEYVVIGAHYDHLGRGEYGSLAPSKIGELFPGADDNASGTSALLELARLLAPLRGTLPRGILFASFAGEELGIVGSAAFVREPTLPLAKAVAMLNMDMVGRVQASKIYIGGVGTAAPFRSILDAAVPKAGLVPEYALSGYSSSDETSFLAEQIPVLFFFSGLHSDYHTPSDTWDKIDAVAGAQVTNLVADTALHVAALPEKPAFVAVAEPQPAQDSGHGSGYGPYFGSIPDFGQIESGVRFSGVRPDSPAAKAGLKAGDVLTQFGVEAIKNLYDFTDALRRSNVGDVVEVTVLRDGKPLTVRVRLEQRR
jgi:hypothetical protein